MNAIYFSRFEGENAKTPSVNAVHFFCFAHENIKTGVAIKQHVNEWLQCERSATVTKNHSVRFLLLTS